MQKNKSHTVIVMKVNMTDGTTTKRNVAATKRKSATLAATKRANTLMEKSLDLLHAILVVKVMVMTAWLRIT
jgi:hypothetical protein